MERGKKKKPAMMVREDKKLDLGSGVGVKPICCGIKKQTVKGAEMGVWLTLARE